MQAKWLAHLLEFEITNEGSALHLLHVVGEVCVLQARSIARFMRLLRSDNSSGDNRCRSKREKGRCSK